MDYDIHSLLEEFIDENGELDMEKFEAAVEKYPELLTLIQDHYAAFDDSYTAALLQPETLTDLFRDCVIPNIQSAMSSLHLLLFMCVFCCILLRLVRIPSLLHIIYLACGSYLLYHMFELNMIIIILYFLLSVLLIKSNFLRGKQGCLLSIFTLICVVFCEFYIHAERWHNIRGAQMIISMKVISVGFDLDSESLKSVSLLELGSYLLHPATCVFGPWISFNDYSSVIEGRRVGGSWSVRLYTLVITSLLTVLFLCWSTCFISWIISPSDSYNKWIHAYRDAQSFRFSHYFICSLSELTLLLSGITTAATNSKPLRIEMPRSLVNVVRYWNLPMHQWLKSYVFNVSRGPLGTFAAILLTYVASSLLHGLNFQLAAVLLSLGVYSYIEHSLRAKLSIVFDACIQARACSSGCTHLRTWRHPCVLLLNSMFCLLAVYHLAYLGVLFDSTGGEQERGYSMLHALDKWSQLDFASHIVAFVTLIFYWLIK